MREERWENTGRDRITLQELMELNEDGFEFFPQRRIRNYVR